MLFLNYLPACEICQYWHLKDKHVWARVQRREMTFAYHFINSTVHTSKVIWALKTIKKLMNAFLLTRSDTATWNNGSLFWQKVEVPQHREWGLQGVWGAGTHPASLRLSTDLGPGLSWDLSQISTHRWGLMRPTRQRGHINTSNTAQSCLQRWAGTDQYLHALFKHKALF